MPSIRCTECGTIKLAWTDAPRSPEEELAAELGESEAAELLGTFPPSIRRAIAPYAESTDRAQLDSLAHDDAKARENLSEADPWLTGGSGWPVSARANLDPGTVENPYCGSDYSIAQCADERPHAHATTGASVYVGSFAEAIAAAAEWATVSVGRNIGNDESERLEPGEWARFRLAIDDLFNPPGGDFRIVGTSYSGEHGTEDTYVVGGTLHIDRVPVRVVLARLARRYGQTAIALTFGGERVKAECEHESLTVNGNTVCDDCGLVNP